MRLLTRLFAALGYLIPVAVGPAENVQVSASEGAVPQVITSPDSLILEWQVPGVEFRSQPDGTILVEAPGFSQTRRPGSPRLPFTAALVAIPSGSVPTIQILEIEEENLSLPGPLVIGGIPQGVLRTPDGKITGGAFASAQVKIPFNPDPVVLEPLGVMRGVHLARVIFYPARPEGEGLRLATRVRLAVHFNPTDLQKMQSEPKQDPILEALKSAVANPEQVQPEASAGRPISRKAGTLEGEQPVAVVEVSQRGLVSLDFEGLEGAGIALEGFNPLNLRLTRAGSEVPFEWEGDGDPHFEPGERLLFYADPRFSRWTPVDVYFLTQALTSSPLMKSRSANPAGLPAGNLEVEALFEVNRIYTPDCYCAPIPAGRDGDRWVWEELNLPSRPDGQYDFELGPVQGGQPGTVTLWLIGYTDTAADPDHRVSVAINGVDLGEFEWDGKRARAGDLPIPADVLKSGKNTLSLHLPGISGVSVEGAWLDAFSIRYARGEDAAGNELLFRGEGESRSYTFSLETASGLRAYDVSDPGQPARLSGVKVEGGKTVILGDPTGQGERSYFVTNEGGISTPERIREYRDLTTGGNRSGAAYLILSHPDFLPALPDLVQVREAQGLSVLVEDVLAIYDAYGEGRPDPAAIRAYLEEAYHSWEVRPVYVLLVGDGTSDPKRVHPGSSPTFIPPFLADVDPWAGETAADNRYVTIEGDDNLPEMLIGRLPVNSLAEAQAVVEKIIRYETQPAAGSWPGKGIVVADDPDGGGDFPHIADQMIEPLADSPLQLERLYYRPPQIDETEIRQEIRSAWNEGSAWVVYTGHASIHQWGAEQFLHLEDVGSLQNGGRLPLLLEMTCFTASFHVPGFPTLDEALLRHPRGGVISAWGSTGLGIATGHATLAESFLAQAVLDGASTGEAALAGKLALAARGPDHLDLIDTFTLLGDPATRLNLSAGNELFYLPLIQ